MKRVILIIAIAVMAACKSKDKPSVKQAGRDTDYSFGPLKDTIPVNQPFTDADFDVFGEIKIGQPYMETISVLGSPASTSKATVWGADGQLHSDWDYKTKGLVVNISADPMNENNTKMVFSITAKAPCSYKTSRGIGIGSSYDEVTAAYKNAIDQSSSDPTLITVGSVYGGIIFSFKDSKVETIFYGAAAE